MFGSDNSPDNEESELKVVVRGLPFEARDEDVLTFFNIEEEQLSLPKWSDSGRCRGVAFIELESQDEVERIKNMNGEDFTVEGNIRQIVVSDYEKRPPRKQRRRRRPAPRQQVFEPDSQSSKEIYVSNVPFQAEKEDFHRVFGDCDKIEDITIPTIYSSGRPKGFAFVRFASVEGRDRALDLDGTTMIDREIGVRENRGRATTKRQAPRHNREGLSDKPEQCSTIFVGNLPWETTEEELIALFKDCGEIRSARIVRQSWTNRSRGFGYVEFVEEASVDTAVQQNLTVGERQLRIDFAENMD